MADESPIVQQALAKLAADRATPVEQADVVQALVPDYRTIAPEQVTAGQPEYVSPEQQHQQNIAEAMAAAPTPIGGLKKIGSALNENVVVPAAEYVVQSDQFTPKAKQMATNILAPPAREPAAVAAEGPIVPIEDLMAAEPQATTRAIQPTQMEIDAKITEALGPVREAVAFDEAFKEVEKIKLENARREEARNAELDKEYEKLDSQVRNSSLVEIMSRGSFGQKLGASIAIAMGGVSQGLTKSRSNPVLDMFDKMADQQAAKDKLTDDRKNVLKQQLLQQGKMDIDKLENATQNAFRKSQLQLMKQQMEQRQQQLRDELRVKLQGQSSNKYSGYALSPEEYTGLSPEERRAVVTLQNGKRVMASNSTDAREYSKFSTEIVNALDSVKKLQQLGESTPRSMAVTNPLEYAKRRAAAESMKTKIVGALRLPYTGPGVLTDNEREALLKTLGSPTDMLAIKSIEMAKLNQVKSDLEANLSSTAKARGILEPVVDQNFYVIQGRAVPEAQVLEMYSKAKPNMPKDKLLQLIQSKLPRM